MLEFPLSFDHLGVFEKARRIVGIPFLFASFMPAIRLNDQGDVTETIIKTHGNSNNYVVFPWSSVDS